MEQHCTISSTWEYFINDTCIYQILLIQNLSNSTSPLFQICTRKNDAVPYILSSINGPSFM